MPESAHSQLTVVPTARNFNARAVQVAAWLVWKNSEENQLYFALALFGYHLGLGNWWNGKTGHRELLSPSAAVSFT